MQSPFDVLHHGAVNGVTGSCHELQYKNPHNIKESILIDCGLFQGIEAELEPSDSDAADSLLGTQIPFEINHVKALVVTHVHIDHVGRIPHLLAKGFKGPIYCSEPSAILLPLVLEDAIKVGFTRNKKIIQQFLVHIKKQIVPVKYGKWQAINDQLKIKLKPAGHILGSAYVTCKLTDSRAGKEYEGVPKAFASLLGRATPRPTKKTVKTIVFSGDLGAPYSPLLKNPKSPWRCDTLVMESTYGDKNHINRKARRQELKAIIEKALQNKGTVLIPAFSMGRTQELLYELEQIIHHETTGSGAGHPRTGQATNWQDLEIIIDSPLAAKFTQV